MTDHGLTHRQLGIIKDVLRPYINDIEKVGLFGSRATGAYRDNSDIDLVIYGTLKKEDVDRLFTRFDDCDLPVTVDVNVYDLITYPPLKAHIDSAMQPLFLKEDLNP